MWQISMQVHVQVAIPTKISGDEKRLIEELREASQAKGKSGGWFGSKK